MDNAFNTQAGPAAVAASSPALPSPAVTQSHIAAKSGSVAIFSSSNEISVNQSQLRHGSRLADWLSSSAASYVPAG